MVKLSKQQRAVYNAVKHAPNRILPVPYKPGTYRTLQALHNKAPWVTYVWCGGTIWVGVAANAYGTYSAASAAKRLARRQAKLALYA